MTSTVITEFVILTADPHHSTMGVASVTGGGNGSGTVTSVHPPWVWYYPWTWAQILQLLIACVGLIGNLLVILVLLRQKAYKHTMDIFIGALALADFVSSLFTVPVPLAIQVPNTALGRAYCKWVFVNNSLFVSINASIYTLVGITVERFIAVVFPFHLARVVTNRRVFIYVVLVWVFAVVASTSVLTIEVRDSRCTDTFSPSDHKLRTLIMVVLRIAIPCFIMITAQVFTAWALHRQSTAMRHALAGGGGVGDQSHITARNRVVKLMFIVTLVFLFSLVPHTLVQAVYALMGDLTRHLNSTLYPILRFLAFINFCANPLIYATRYPRFRSAVKKMLTSRAGDRETSSVFGQESSPAESVVSTISKSV